MAEKGEKYKYMLFKAFALLIFIFTFIVFLVALIYTSWSLYLIFAQLFTTPISFHLILELILNLLTISVEIIGIFYTLMLFYHMGNTCFSPSSLSEPLIRDLTSYPFVSVVIPTHKPDLSILEQTLQSIRESNYPSEKISIFIGDDTEETDNYLQSMSSVLLKYNAHHVYDPKNKQYKAGMLNIVLSQIQSDFVVLLDYDHIIMPNFIRKSTSLLVNNEELSFVTAKVNFRNLQNKLQIWESMMYAQFFEVFSRSKHKRRKVIFNGSTACFRKSCLLDIGGISTDTLTEDVCLTIDLFSRGHKSALLDEYGSYGLVPTTFSSLLSQIFRWAKGAVQSLKLRYKKIFQAKIPIFDRIDLLFSTSIFLITPTMYITVFFYICMYLTSSSVVRLPFEDFPYLLLMPIAFSLAYQLSGVIAIVFADKSGLKGLNIFDLFIFYIIALALNPFTLYFLFRSIFRYSPPNRNKQEWTAQIPFLKISFAITFFGCFTVFLGLLDFLSIGFQGSYWLILGLLGLTMVMTYPFTLFFHLKTRKSA